MSIQELQQLGSPNEKDISPLFPSRTLIDILDERNTSSIRPLMNNLRSVKSEGEIHNMRTAGRISGRAISKAMARSFQTEKELAAWIGYQFTMGGCDDIAYVPVVAGGEVSRNSHPAFKRLMSPVERVMYSLRTERRCATVRSLSLIDIHSRS